MEPNNLPPPHQSIEPLWHVSGLPLQVISAGPDASDSWNQEGHDEVTIRVCKHLFNDGQLLVQVLPNANLNKIFDAPFKINR